MYKNILKDLKQLEDVEVAEHVLSVRGVKKVKPTHVLKRGSAFSLGEEVQPRFLSVLTDKTPAIEATESTSGRRKALAEWLINDTPLTARVMANRIWQFHFGRGIVRSSNNFGLKGDAPTHRALLNYLSATFKEKGWSIKSLHRLIMNSSAYKMNSKFNQQAYDKDPRNDLFWRFNMRRLTGEEIRDSILAVIGKLDLTYGGPSVFPKVSEEVLAGQSSNKWKRSAPESHQYRRSVYTFQKRSLIFPLVETFDAANQDASCEARFETTLPTQALTMLNGDLLNEAAKIMAEDVKKNAKTPTKAVTYLWQKVTGKTPTTEQVNTARKFIKKIKSQGADSDLALQQLCLIMLNLNEFVYLD